MEPATYTHVITVTPSDSADLPNGACRGLLIGGAGNIKINDGLSNNTVTIAVPAGVLPLRVARVFSTDTTATGISALY